MMLHLYNVYGLMTTFDNVIVLVQSRGLNLSQRSSLPLLFLFSSPAPSLSALKLFQRSGQCCARYYLEDSFFILKI